MMRELAVDIEAEAARWVMRLDRHGRTMELLAALEDWLDGDSRRRGAFLQAEAAWAGLAEASPQLAANEDDVIAEDRSPRTRRWFLGGGAAFAASAAGIFFFLPGEQHSTPIGEIRRVPLADGSVATINTASKIEVALAKDSRRIRLDQGEVWFLVAKDKKRPFVVEAGPVRVQAVGTAFSVRRRDGGADVLVSEGVVEAWVSGAEGHRVRIAAGESAFVADNAAITKHTNETQEIDRTLAWRSGKIDLAGETLAAAAEEFNRYNKRKIIIVDPAIASERFYGIFRVDDPMGFATSVRRSLDVPVSVPDGTEIRVGREPG